jgi:hypothetical protein
VCVCVCVCVCVGVCVSDEVPQVMRGKWRSAGVRPRTMAALGLKQRQKNEKQVSTNARCEVVGAGGASAPPVHPCRTRAKGAPGDEGKLA